jgi:hypothetical protein
VVAPGGGGARRAACLPRAGAKRGRGRRVIEKQKHSIDIDEKHSTDVDSTNRVRASVLP